MNCEQLPKTIIYEANCSETHLDPTAFTLVWREAPDQKDECVSNTCPQLPLWV
jgi:hypothetical protein